MNKTVLLLSFLPLILLFACTSKAVTSEKPTLPELLSQEAQSIAKEGWESRWERTLKEARKEGKVVIYGGSAAAGLKLQATDIIKNKFGIDLEVLTTRGGEGVTKIAAERRAGLYIPDVYASGIDDMFDPLKQPMGAIAPLESVLMLPEVTEQKVWYGNKLPFVDKDHMIFNWAGVVNSPMIINTRMAQLTEIKSYQDLLNPRWKGKIVANDPTIPGTASTNFIALLYNKIVDERFFRDLIKNQDMEVTRDQNLQILWVIREKYYIGLWASTGRAREYLEAATHIVWHTPVEGTHLGSSGSGLALMDRAPHPNAAIVLINWFLGREGQILIQKATSKQSMRTDIPLEGLEPIMVRQPGVKYFPKPSDNETFAAKERPQYEALAKEIFAPLTGR